MREEQDKLNPQEDRSEAEESRAVEPIPGVQPKCFFFGCWNEAGHFLFGPDGRWPKGFDGLEYYDGRTHLDGTLAPRKHRRTGELCWSGMGVTDEQRQRLRYDGDEYPQGQFLRHVLNSGYTAIQWWDRCQGDGRGACNSTLLLEGRRTTAEMLGALRANFPHVLANLERAGVTLVEVASPKDPQ